MIPKELFKKIRRIEITTSRMVSDMFAGQYHSVFKGQGIEFDEVREYQPGDDVRTIDWNVTARTGKPHVKKFVEERELTVMVMVDLSRSSKFGSVHALKSQIAAEVAAVLALSAIQNNDKVGLVVFTDTIEKYIPPRKGRSHVLRVIREILYFEPKNHKTDIKQSIEFLNKVLTRKSIVFLISDFLLSGKDETAEEQARKDLKKVLSIANKRHDIVAITLNDPREFELPDCGLIMLEDAETGAVQWVDSSDVHLRNDFYIENTKRLSGRERFFRSIGIDYMNIYTNKPYVNEIIKFFLKRQKKKR